VKQRDRTPGSVRVCIVAPSLEYVGGQAVIADHLMARLKSDPDIELSFIPHNPRLPGSLRMLQRMKYVRTVVTSVAYVMLLLRELRRQDVVHVFSASYWSFLLAPTPAVLVGRLYRKRVVLNYHSGEAADHLARWRRSALPILRLANVIAVPSGYLVDVFARFGLVAQPVFNFIDPERIPHRERTILRPIFLANRNFASHYNVASVLRAFHLIQQEVPDARLNVAGDGEQREMLHALARELGLRNVEFLGQVPPDSMPALYDEADIYLNASKIDNMPISIIEAFAAGLPVVTSNAGGIPYIVTNGVTGLLAEPDDHIRLAEHALRLLREPNFAHRITAAARDEALREYTWPAVHQAWRQLYGLDISD
jgi:glycosyltransferase involved in cell wall biosynthesis